MGLRPVIVLSLLSVAFGETFLRPHIKSQNFADKNLYCAGDVNNVCLSGLCYDSINLLDQRISSGCATVEMCAKTECKLFETKFVCCCSGTVCNGKSASLLRSRLRIEQERMPPPIIYKIDGKARLIPRDVKVEQQQEKMIEYEEKEGLSAEKFEEKKKAEVIAEVESTELSKELSKNMSTVVKSAEELPQYTPGMATKGVAVKKVDPTQVVSQEKENEEELPKVGEMKDEEKAVTESGIQNPAVQENPVTTNQEIKEDFVVEKKEVKLEATTEAQVEESKVESVEENVELKTIEPMEKAVETTEALEEATTQAAKPALIPLTEGPIGGVGLGDETTTTAPKEPYLPPFRLPIKSGSQEETGSTEKTTEEPEESHVADDVFFKPSSSEKVEVNDAVVAGVKIQAEESKVEKVEEPVVKDIESVDGEKVEESEERPELGVGAGDDKSEEVKTEARPLNNKESSELEGDPLPASKPKRTTADQPIKKTSSSTLIPVLIILAILALIAGGGFVLWRKKKINPKRRNQQQKKDTELVLVDPLLRENQEKVVNETIEAPSQA
ncbi:unnamed protein product, partial [Mesorhabditis belari]|uniref:Uncharacterized protein n=1 Tax=Mesorhabditis belari TaxID=2138241 RepID=A0AAF3FK96_9BILA